MERHVCWLMKTNCSSMHRLGTTSKLQGGDLIGMGERSRSPTKFKVIAKVTQCHLKVTLKAASENHSEGHSKSFQGHFEFNPPAGYAVCDGNLSSSFFFFLLLATRLFHILPNVRFWPNLVKVTSILTTTQAQTMMGSAVTVGSLRSKRLFSPKRHQVLQNT